MNTVTRGKWQFDEPDHKREWQFDEHGNNRHSSLTWLCLTPPAHFHPTPLASFFFLLIASFLTPIFNKVLDTTKEEENMIKLEEKEDIAKEEENMIKMLDLTTPLLLDS